MEQQAAPLDLDRAGPRSATPLVLVHAGIADRRMWDPQWGVLSSSRDTVRVDLRGFGESTVRPDGALSHVDDVLATLDGLGIDRCHLVGASLGAGVVVEVALSRPEIVESLFLCPPGGSLLTDLTADLRAFIDAENAALEREDLDAAVQANLAAWVVGNGRRESDVDADVLARVRQMQRRVFEIQEPWGELQEADLEPPAAERLAELAVRTLVLTGAHDLDTTKAAAQHVASHAPEVHLVEWPDVAHLPSLERPDAFLALLLDWVGGA